MVKLATCGIEGKAQEMYLNKIKKFKFKIVSNDEDYDFIIMNNRVIFDQPKNSEKIQTCFEK